MNKLNANEGLLVKSAAEEERQKSTERERDFIDRPPESFLIEVIYQRLLLPLADLSATS